MYVLLLQSSKRNYLHGDVRQGDDPLQLLRYKPVIPRGLIKALDRRPLGRHRVQRNELIRPRRRHLSR